MREQHHLSLYELNGLVRSLIENSLDQNYWVEAEISELRESGGHCYIELIEKDARTNTPIAKASARCWRSTWALVRSHFVRVTGKELAKGMKVLLKVYAQFHENYGFSWIITDIDPTYTLGDMALKRQRIVRQLKEEGVFDANRELSLPLFCQRIAVISSASAAGYGDFCHHLSENQYGYAFQTTLFSAVMQGEGVEQSIISALNKIFDSCEQFDCVVITRGGGATSDLSGFDALDLARNVANFPLPVITAIGHDRDESVLDMISKVRVKTPTAAAAFLIEQLHAVDSAIDHARERIGRVVTARMQAERMRINHLSVRIPALFAVVHATQSSRLDLLLQRAATAVGTRLSACRMAVSQMSAKLPFLADRELARERHRLEMLSQRVSAVDPQRILDRGYTITLHDGIAVKSAADVSAGDVIVTRLKDGTVESVVG